MWSPGAVVGYDNAEITNIVKHINNFTVAFKVLGNLWIKWQLSKPIVTNPQTTSFYNNNKGFGTW